MHPLQRDDLHIHSPNTTLMPPVPPKDPSAVWVVEGEGEGGMVHCLTMLENRGCSYAREIFCHVDSKFFLPFFFTSFHETLD